MLTLNGDIIVGGAHSARGEDEIVGSGELANLFGYLLAIVCHHHHLVRREIEIGLFSPVILILVFFKVQNTNYMRP